MAEWLSKMSKTHTVVLHMHASPKHVIFQNFIKLRLYHIFWYLSTYHVSSNTMYVFPLWLFIWICIVFLQSKMFLTLWVLWISYNLTKYTVMFRYLQGNYYCDIYSLQIMPFKCLKKFVVSFSKITSVSLDGAIVKNWKEHV